MDNWKKLGWKEDPEPYWNGCVTSRKILRQVGDKRIVRVGMKRSNWYGMPWGNVMFGYEVEYLNDSGAYAGEWELDSSHPNYEAAKKYLGWK